MIQERLTDLGILYIEKNILIALNLDVAVNYFATKYNNNRKIAILLIKTSWFCSIFYFKLL